MCDLIVSASFAHSHQSHSLTIQEKIAIIIANLNERLIHMKLNLSRNKFPFEDVPNTLCFTCCHVVNEHRPILYVSHDEDGLWQFLCGKTHSVEEAVVVSLAEILKLDPTVGDFASLGYGESAMADSKTSGWTVWKKKT